MADGMTTPDDARPMAIVGKRGPEVVSGTNGFGAIIRDHAGRVVAEAAPSIMEAGASASIARVRSCGLDPIAFAKGASRARKLPKWKRFWLWLKAI